MRRNRYDASALKEAAQHPGIFLVNLHALGQQVGGWFVTGLVDQRENAASSLGNGLLAGNELLDHVLGADLAFAFLDHGQSGEFGVGARGSDAEGADAFGNHVQRVP